MRWLMLSHFFWEIVMVVSTDSPSQAKHVTRGCNRHVAPTGHKHLFGDVAINI